jgi:hypothetical protein
VDEQPVASKPAATAKNAINVVFLFMSHFLSLASS